MVFQSEYTETLPSFICTSFLYPNVRMRNSIVQGQKSIIEGEVQELIIWHYFNVFKELITRIPMFLTSYFTLPCFDFLIFLFSHPVNAALSIMSRGSGREALSVSSALKEYRRLRVQSASYNLNTNDSSAWTQFGFNNLFPRLWYYFFLAISYLSLNALR